jgi:hypothetical protein
MTASTDPAPGTREYIQRVQLGLAAEARLASSAAEQLNRVTVELVNLMSARAERNWTSQEFERYLVLSRSEHSCELSYAMARRRFDALRGRLLSRPDPSGSA